MHFPLSVVVILGLVVGKTVVNIMVFVCFGLVTGQTVVNKVVFVCFGLVNPQKVFVFNSSVNYSFLLLGLMGSGQWCTLQWCMSVVVGVVLAVVVVVLAIFNTCSSGIFIALQTVFVHPMWARCDDST